MKKRILIYIIIVILLFFLSSVFVIPELSITKKIIKFILIAVLVYSTIYNVTKSKLFIKILFVTISLISLVITYFLEPANGFILYSGKEFIAKSNDIYLYRNYAMIDGYLLLYEKDKILPVLHFKTSRELFTTESDKIGLKEKDNKIYIQINEVDYLIEKTGYNWKIQSY